MEATQVISWVTSPPVYPSPLTATTSTTSTTSTTPATTPTPNPDGSKVPPSIPETPLSSTFPTTSDQGFEAGQQPTTITISLNRYMFPPNHLPSFRYILFLIKVHIQGHLSDMALRRGAKLTSCSAFQKWLAGGSSSGFKGFSLASSSSFSYFPVRLG